MSPPNATIGAFLTDTAISATPGIPGIEVSDHSSLVDLLRARESGVGVRALAPFFRSGLRHFQTTGQNLYGRVLLGPSDAEALIDYPHEPGQRKMIILASNNYLGLTNHPRVIQAAQQAAEQYGTGSGSSPLLVGASPITKDLESKLAQLKGAEEACVFSTGYAANVGAISAVAGKGDVVVLDRLAHASMVDGAKLSGAHIKVFHHNDAAHLDRVLERNRAARTKLVAVEGIYSMDGDIAPLDKIWKVAKRHDALLLVDEAHATGAFGPGGRGAAAHFGLEGQIDLHIGTLSKALGASGGFVAGSSDLVTYVRYFARSGMFSTAPSPMTIAAASAAIDVMREEPERRARLQQNAYFMHEQLRNAGFKTSAAPSHILPVIVGNMKALRHMALELHRGNICVNAVPFPAVPQGSERLRISLIANHTPEQLEQAIDCLKVSGRNAGVL
jgi:8-amino-7-oxononanoate synthase